MKSKNSRPLPSVIAAIALAWLVRLAGGVADASPRFNASVPAGCGVAE
ncbi:MAG: hypothetical protein ACN6OQ_09805 [Paraburkholderia nemoris]